MLLNYSNCFQALIEEIYSPYADRVVALPTVSTQECGIGYSGHYQLDDVRGGGTATWAQCQ